MKHLKGFIYQNLSAVFNTFLTKRLLLATLTTLLTAFCPILTIFALGTSAIKWWKCAKWIFLLTCQVSLDRSYRGYTGHTHYKTQDSLHRSEMNRNWMLTPEIVVLVTSCHFSHISYWKTINNCWHKSY